MADNFAREVARTVVAHSCQNAGFTGIQGSACETFANVIQKYIEEVGYRAHMYAELGGRVEVNFIDVKRVFEDLSISLQDLSVYASALDETPFPKTIPEFPVRREIIKPEEKKTDLTDPEEPLPPHIPSFLPPFPDKHTYITNPLFGERIDDPSKVHRLRVKRKRQVETAVSELSERLEEKPIASYDHESNPDGNPYLVSPQDSGRIFDHMDSGEGPSAPAPTPLAPVSSFVTGAYVHMKTEEVKKEEREKRLLMRKKQRQQAKLDENSEKAKKRAKYEKILGFTHEHGMDTLESGGSSLVVGEDGKAKRGNPKSPRVGPSSPPMAGM